MSDLTKIIEGYLKAWSRKDAARFAALVAPDIRLKGPLRQLEGRGAFVDALTRMFPIVEKAELRTLFTRGDCALAVYDLVCAPPIGRSRIAELLEVRDGLIASSELFFDTVPFTSAQTGEAAA